MHPPESGLVYIFLNALGTVCTAFPRCLAGDHHCRAARGKISCRKILFGRNVPWF